MSGLQQYRSEVRDWVLDLDTSRPNRNALLWLAGRMDLHDDVEPFALADLAGVLGVQVDTARQRLKTLFRDKLAYVGPTGGALFGGRVLYVHSRRVIEEQAAHEIHWARMRTHFAFREVEQALAQERERYLLRSGRWLIGEHGGGVT